MHRTCLGIPRGADKQKGRLSERLEQSTCCCSSVRHRVWVVFWSAGSNAKIRAVDVAAVIGFRFHYPLSPFRASFPGNRPDLFVNPFDVGCHCCVARMGVQANWATTLRGSERREQARTSWLHHNLVRKSVVALSCGVWSVAMIPPPLLVRKAHRSSGVEDTGEDNPVPLKKVLYPICKLC